MSLQVLCLGLRFLGACRMNYSNRVLTVCQSISLALAVNNAQNRLNLSESLIKKLEENFGPAKYPVLSKVAVKNELILMCFRSRDE